MASYELETIKEIHPPILVSEINIFYLYAFLYMKPVQL